MICSIVCIARAEHEYIKEFVDYHQSIGFDRFYIYDNGLPEDEPLSFVLPGYSNCSFFRIEGNAMQIPAYTHFVSTILPLIQDDWIAVIDVDEFVVPNKLSENYFTRSFL
jgi:hypothetical protein